MYKAMCMYKNDKSFINETPLDCLKLIMSFNEEPKEFYKKKFDKVIDRLKNVQYVYNHRSEYAVNETIIYNDYVYQLCEMKENVNFVEFYKIVVLNPFIENVNNFKKFVNHSYFDKGLLYANISIIFEEYYNTRDDGVFEFLDDLRKYNRKYNKPDSDDDSDDDSNDDDSNDEDSDDDDSNDEDSDDDADDDLDDKPLNVGVMKDIFKNFFDDDSDDE